MNFQFLKKQPGNPRENFESYLREGLFRKGNNQGIEIDSDGLARLKRELFWTLGEMRTHSLLARWGVNCGLKDAGVDLSESPLLRSLGEIAYAGSPAPNEYIFEIKNSKDAFSAAAFQQPPIKTHQCWQKK